ncbi:MAG: ZIP family metal transporter, partial [Candidatus Sericytochromatia bacterium]
RLRSPLLAYAIGTLLGAVFLGLLPRALELGGIREMLMVTLAGFMGFFLVEKMLRVPHVHSHAGIRSVRRPTGWIILWGDALHNFVDGVIIATAFLVSVPLGIMTALAVVAHEIPQELGDFVILLEAGWDRWRAFWMNALSALATVPGALLAYWASGVVEAYVPYLLAIAAASFLYIAATDLVPLLHHDRGGKPGLIQSGFMLLGIFTLWGLHHLLG